AIYVVENEVEIYLVGAIDKEKEKQRLAKQTEELQKILRSSEAKLNNDDFLQKAPGSVVNKEKQKYEEAREELKRLQKKQEEIEESQQ
ncbi:MAG TPA: hypothetical protein VKO42_02830, partial [Patescibacteria group bacterium]|nr:hypothetical protein [Patescibacteria group bacterium]